MKKCAILDKALRRLKQTFIGIAEKLSLYPQLACFIIERSISEMAPIMREHPDLALGINITAFKLQDPRFLPYLDKLTTEFGIPNAKIKIEITERIDLPLLELAEFSRDAKAMGFVVVLDDFGTGVANLVWLTKMDFDYIKVDRVFVNALNYDIKDSYPDASIQEWYFYKSLPSGELRDVLNARKPRS